MKVYLVQFFSEVKYDSCDETVLLAEIYVAADTESEAVEIALKERNGRTWTEIGLKIIANNIIIKGELE